jgi:hypothetical protein
MLLGEPTERYEIRESSLRSEARRSRWSAVPALRSRHDQCDDAVDRFIQYDIGRLPGAAGVQALRDFQQLGPDAIPAMVRGLNRAAALRASCPIAVISSRLNTLLNQTDDPRMIRYALENIGRDVDTHAPHYRSIRSLLHRLKKTFAAYAASTARSEPARAWWLPEDWKPAGTDDWPADKASGFQAGAEPRILTPSRTQDNRAATRGRPGWGTLESLMNPPATLDIDQHRGFEGSDAGRRDRIGERGR